jgi:uncharacterized protein with ParB-like and HNH nuclease domain
MTPQGNSCARHLGTDPAELLRFYGYLTNKVKVIRIETPTVAMALKIFETINDRGVGLDAMDLLKNLLFMHAKGDEFGKLKTIWKNRLQGQNQLPKVVNGIKFKDGIEAVAEIKSAA